MTFSFFIFVVVGEGEGDCDSYSSMTEPKAKGGTLLVVVVLGCLGLDGWHIVSLSLSVMDCRCRYLICSATAKSRSRYASVVVDTPVVLAE